MGTLPPGKVEVIVIGGGIVGSAIAYFLARRGARVVLLERHSRLNFEQSGRSNGFVRQQGRHPRELPLVMEANRLWRNLESELDADLEWIQAGTLRLAASEEELGQLEAIAELGRQFGLDTKLLSSGEVRAVVPALGQGFLGGIYTASDGQAEPAKAGPAFAAAAEKHGGRTYVRCCVEKIRLAGDRVTGVITSQGELDADVVVCAAGAASRLVLSPLGVDLPLRLVRVTCSETTAQPFVTGTTIWTTHLAFRQRRNGAIWFAARGSRLATYELTPSSFRHLGLFLPNYVRNRRMFRVRIGREFLRELSRSLPFAAAHRRRFADPIDREPAPEPRAVVRTLERLRRMFPALTNLDVRRSWAGVLDITPDALPVLGEVKGIRGLLLAAGFSGHGFGIAPVVGRLLSELVLDGKPSMDIGHFRLSRFREGDMADSGLAL